MDGFEIITLVISGFALLVSAVTGYLTLLTRFKGVVYSRRWISVFNMEGMPCLVLECEFTNEGARPGAIEDILVEVKHEETGNSYIFVPFLVKTQFSVFENYQISDFLLFSGISLGGKQRREYFVVFKPNDPGFQSMPGTMIVRLGTCNAISKGKWKKIQQEMSFSTNEAICSSWNDAGSSPITIPTNEIQMNRQKYLKSR